MLLPESGEHLCTAHACPSCMAGRVLKFGYNIRLHRGDCYRQRGEEIEVKNGPGDKRERAWKTRKRKLLEVDDSQLLQAAV